MGGCVSAVEVSIPLNSEFVETVHFDFKSSRK